MSKSIVSIITLLFITSCLVFAQGSHKLQLNGGMISPISSSNGLTSSVQFNYYQNDIVNFYVSAGFSVWDKFNVIYTEDWTPIQKETNFRTYASNEHIMIPVFIGTKFNVHTHQYFTTFVDLEIGYTFLQYNSYDHWRSINPETGEVVGYYPDPDTREEIKDNILGIGLGLGISHPMSQNINLILTVKFNTNLYSEYSDTFGSRETYTSFLAGFNFSI